MYMVYQVVNRIVFQLFIDYPVSFFRIIKNAMAGKEIA